MSSYASELLQLNDSWSSVHKNGIQPTVSDVLFLMPLPSLALQSTDQASAIMH